MKKGGFSFPDADLLAADHKSRTRAVNRVFAARPLLAEEEEKWKAAADEGAFADREYVELMTALGGTPEAVRNEFAETSKP